VALGLAAAGIAILSTLKIQASGGPEKWIRMDADEELELRYASPRLYELAWAMAFGPGEITGTYELRSKSESRQEAGKFTLITDEAGYVTAYDLAATDGRTRRLTNGFCWFLQGEGREQWEPRSNSPIRIYQGLISELRLL
jgi:hypothetical protein